MPPNYILQNVVERVAEALHKQQPDLQIPAAVIRAASEQYRRLETRVRVGSLPHGDSQERRAVVLLEACARHGTGQRLLSWPVLGAAVHVKTTSSLPQLQHVLLNFLQPASAGRQPAAQQVGSSAEVVGGTTAARSRRVRNHVVNYKEDQRGAAAAAPLYVPKVLPALVIRLAGHLVDPHGTQKLAAQLLNDIHSYYCQDHYGTISSAADRRGHLYDLQRYAPAYEAAALYHIATTVGNTSSGAASGAPRVGKKAAKKVKTKDEALHPDDDDETGANNDDNDDQQRQQQDLSEQPLRGLQLADLMDASTEFTYLEVKQVLPRVRELARKVRRDPKKERDGTARAAAQAVAGLLQRQPWQLADPPPVKRHGAAPARAAAHSVADASGRAARCSRDDDALPNHAAAAPPPPPPSFADWKVNILSAARDQARRDRTAPGDDLSDRQALASAADAVLRKYGLLSTAPGAAAANVASS